MPFFWLGGPLGYQMSAGCLGGKYWSPWVESPGCDFFPWIKWPGWVSKNTLLPKGSGQTQLYLSLALLTGSAFITHGILTQHSDYLAFSIAWGWGVNHRLSSSYFPHSNTRAELGLKAMKRLVRGNAGSNGELDNNAFGRALLMYRNTPMQEVGLSPGQIVFGWESCDTMPFKPGEGAMPE